MEILVRFVEDCGIVNNQILKISSTADISRKQFSLEFFSPF